MPKNRDRRYINNCFWLLLPVLLLNILFAAKLPPAYQPDVFWNDIPTLISLPENLLRVIVMILPALVPLGFHSLRQRIGWAIYAVGFLVYTGSWAVLINWPDHALFQNPIGFLAPAWTPAFLFLGISLIGGPSFYRQLHLTPWIYLILSAGFLVAHNAHAWLVFARLG